MADEYKHIDITIDQDNCDDGILQLLHKIRPDWKEEHISSEVLNSFYINLKIQFCVFCSMNFEYKFMVFEE